MSVIITMKCWGFKYTPPTPEQAAAYEEKLRSDPVGYIRVMEQRGDISKEVADEWVRAARIRRKLEKRRRKQG